MKLPDATVPVKVKGMKFDRKFGSLLTVIFVLTVLGGWYFYPKPSPSGLEESFEQGLGGWIVDAEVPPDPNNPGNYVQWQVTRVTNISHTGQSALRLFVDGLQDDGTIWVERNLCMKENSDVSGSVIFYLYSDTESFNTIAAVVASISSVDPEKEAMFVNLGPANQVAGWKRYEYHFTARTNPEGVFWVAVGISVRWETKLTYYLDDVTIIIQ